MSEAREIKRLKFRAQVSDEIAEIDLRQIVGLIVFTPTCELRWNYSNPDRRMLEQKWIEHGTGKIEWREIPFVG